MKCDEWSDHRISLSLFHGHVLSRSQLNPYFIFFLTKIVSLKNMPHTAPHTRITPHTPRSQKMNKIVFLVRKSSSRKYHTDVGFSCDLDNNDIGLVCGCKCVIFIVQLYRMYDMTAAVICNCGPSSQRYNYLDLDWLMVRSNGVTVCTCTLYQCGNRLSDWSHPTL